MLSFAALAIDDQSYATVFATHHRRLVRLAYLLTSDEPTAEDVVATAFIKVHRHWRAGRVDNVGAYLRTAVVNESRTALRSRYRRRARDERRTADDRGRLGHEERLAEHDAMWDAVEALPERMRQCVVLRYYEDLSEQETADVLGVSTGTVKSSLSRGLDRIERRLVATGAVDGLRGGGR